MKCWLLISTWYAFGIDIEIKPSEQSFIIFKIHLNIPLMSYDQSNSCSITWCNAIIQCPCLPDVVHFFVLHFCIV